METLNAYGCPQLNETSFKMQSVAKNEQTVREYLDLAVSENTRRAYRSDLAHFGAWGGQIPCSPELLAAYIAAYAGRLSIATLSRRLASISKAHTMQGYGSPAASDLVRMTMRGVRRLHGKPQVRVAPLLKEELIVVLAYTPDDLRGLRDKAVLLAGFCAALRRSEVSQMKLEHLAYHSHGLLLTLPRSKTDQTGEGRSIGIPAGRGKICPVAAIQNWITASGITEGAVFRAVEGGKVTQTGLCDRSIANIIKLRVRDAGLNPARYSGHSLRAGLATSAAQHGISSFKIREQTGHKSEAMLARYIRDGNLFRENAAALF
jgi:integrase